MVNDALKIMNRYTITSLSVVEKEVYNAPIIGILHIHHVYGFAKHY